MVGGLASCRRGFSRIQGTPLKGFVRRRGGDPVGASASTGGGSMTSKVEKSIEVEAPLQRVYNQWTQFEQFPQFMGGVEEVKQLSDTSLHWVAKIAGVKREWDAAIVEQVPDRKVAGERNNAVPLGPVCPSI